MVRETLVMYQQACDQVRFYRDSILPAVERNLAQAAALVEKDIKPITDVRAGTQYRIRMAQALAFRALRLGSARARRSSA